VYVGDVESSLDRPVRELKAFAKVELAPGAVRTRGVRAACPGPVVLQPGRRALVLESGDFEIGVGASSRTCG